MTRTDQILIGRKEAAKLLCLGQRTFDRMNASGQLGPAPVRIGGKVLWRADELKAWAESADGQLPNRAQWQAMKRRFQHRSSA